MQGADLPTKFVEMADFCGTVRCFPVMVGCGKLYPRPENRGIFFFAAIATGVIKQQLLNAHNTFGGNRVPPLSLY